MKRRSRLTAAVESAMPSMGATSPVRGQAVHGTIAVVKYEPQRLVIAADSRHNFGIGVRSHWSDDACKIAVLGEYTAFVSAGLVGYDNAGPQDQLATWRATEVARSHFAQFVKGCGEWEDLHVDDLAMSIGLSLAERITEFAQYAPATIQSATVGGLLTTALLATGCGKDVIVVLVQVGVDEHGRVQLLPSRRITPDVCPPCALGRGEVVIELLELSTQRARDEMDVLQKELARLPVAEQEIRRLTRLVELSIAWLPDDAGVGGPVDVLELRAGRRAQWIQRKPQCTH